MSLQIVTDSRTPTIEDLPRSLRRVAKKMVETCGFLSLKDACRLVGANYKSVTVMISRYSRKGINFWDIVNSSIPDKLNARKMEICQKVVERALTGTHKDRELYFKLTRDLPVDKSALNVNVGVSFSTVVCPPPDPPTDIVYEVPAEVAETNEEAKVWKED